MTLHRRFAAQAEVAEPVNDLVLRSLLRTGDTDADLSVTWVRLEGHHRRLHSVGGTRVYVVVAGEGRAQVGEDPPVDLALGDLLAIPGGTPYELWGPMTYLVANQPGFLDGDDVYA